MALQNYVDRVGPVVSAAWLNAVDLLKETIFGNATTKVQARTNLTSDAPLEIGNGGTGSRLGATPYYGQTAAEAAVPVTPTNYSYLPGNVLRYGADVSGTADSSPAWQAAVNSLGANGGTVIVPYGIYKLSSSVVATIDHVAFDIDPGATVNVFGTYGIYYSGASGAAPLSYPRIKGGRFIAGDTTPVAAIYLKNALFAVLEKSYIYGFYTAAGGGSRSGVKVDYTIATQFRSLDIRWCDIGYNIAQDTSLAYRSTSVSWSGGKVGRCARGIYLRDVFGFEMNGEFIAENCSIGVECYGDKNGAGQTNCADGDVDCYFEANGKHIYIHNNGAATCIGISIENAQLERVATNYADTAAFEFAAPGNYKLDLDGTNHRIGGCYFSTAATAFDILIQATASNCRIGPQQRAYSSISDSGIGTIYEVAGEQVGVLPTVDATPSVRGLRICTVTNAAPQSITVFDDGYAGQVIDVRALDGNTTFVHAAAGSGFRMWGAANFNLVSGQSITFINQGSSIWVQTELSHPTALTYTPTNVTPDRVFDANATTVDELADVVGTMIADLKLRGLLQ